jgi:hypothetical protein
MKRAASKVRKMRKSKSRSVSKKSRKSSKSRSRSASKKSRKMRSKSRSRSGSRTRNFPKFRASIIAKLKAENPKASASELMAMVRKAYYGRTPSKSPVKRVRKGKRSVSKMKKAKKTKRVRRASAKPNPFAMFVRKYSDAKRKAMGGNPKQTAVMKALAADWRKGVRSY